MVYVACDQFLKKMEKIKYKYFSHMAIANMGNLPRSEIVMWLNYKFFVVIFCKILFLPQNR
jgi:hypothetical protein